MRLSKPCRSIATASALLRGISIRESPTFPRFSASLLDLSRERLGDPACSTVSPGDNDLSRFDRLGVDGALTPSLRLSPIRDCGRDGAFRVDDEASLALVADVDPAEPSFFWLAIKRLRVELNRFFT